MFNDEKVMPALDFLVEVESSINASDYTYDIWKGRSVQLIVALAQPLSYLQDKGHITLTPTVFLECLTTLRRTPPLLKWWVVHNRKSVYTTYHNHQ